MKSDTENKVEASDWKSKVPVVTHDPELTKYLETKPFAKKLALAEEHLKGVTIPQIKRQSQKS